MAGKRQDWSWLASLLERGEESPSKVADFIAAGGNPSDLVLATLGNRDMQASPCPKSLTALLKARADPGVLDKRIGSPAIHVASWHSSPEVVGLLLEYRADMEANDGDDPTPPLNTALAAGNAPVALSLLDKHANVQWKHKDGATVLHVATSWITDPARAQRRLPPLGEEPRSLVAKLFHNGADPSQREGFNGLTPLEAFRASMKASPWLQDEETGPQFKATADAIFALMSAAEEAVKEKNKGNKSFSEGKHADALEAWKAGRGWLEKEGITGHHMAVLWSNAAMCCKKMGDIEAGRKACEAGLAHFCTPSVRAKLEFNLGELRKLAGQPAAERAAAASAEAARARAKPAAADARRAPELKPGFLSAEHLAAAPLYGPEGSRQGKNMSDLVDAPTSAGMVKVPYGKVVPIPVPHPELDKEPSSDEDEGVRS